MRRIVVVAALTVGMLGFLSQPASAHTVAGVGATNFRTRLLRVTPQPPGLKVKVVDNGRRLELSNATDQEVVVFGYQGEPYLRVGRTGIFENILSPARYINAAGMTSVPSSADAKAPPMWHQVSTDSVVRWHEHRIHWMSKENPPQVRQAPGREHVIIPSWTVPMVQGSTKFEAIGDLTWVPGPNPLPWILLALAVGGGTLFVVARTTNPRVLVGGTALLLVIDVLHAFGVALSAAGSLGSRISGAFSANPWAILAWVVAGVGLAWLRWRKPGGLLFLGGAALVMAYEGGMADLNVLARSQIPFVSASSMAQAFVAISLGLGAGLAAAAALTYLRAQRAAAGPEQADTAQFSLPSDLTLTT